jgi:tryptophan synthase alpha chain
VSRIQSKFAELKRAGRKAFIPYITAGDPDLETSAKLLLELERSGADIIELGIPFSDPMADGPVIQRASERALKNGVTARDCLKLIRQLRAVSEVPIVLFSYLNPLLALGLEGLGNTLREAGVDGVLGTDLVPEEGAEFTRELRGAGLDTIFLIAPTSTEERLKLVSDASTGFIYAVSRTGVTGVGQTLSEAAATLVHRVRKFSDLPVAVGFGVSNADHVRQVWAHADAAVVGSRIVAEIEASAGRAEVVARVGALIRLLVSARDPEPDRR